MTDQPAGAQKVTLTLVFLIALGALVWTLWSGPAASLPLWARALLTVVALPAAIFIGAIAQIIADDFRSAGPVLLVPAVAVPAAIFVPWRKWLTWGIATQFTDKDWRHFGSLTGIIAGTVIAALVAAVVRRDKERAPVALALLATFVFSSVAAVNLASSDPQRDVYGFDKTDYKASKGVTTRSERRGNIVASVFRFVFSAHGWALIGTAVLAALVGAMIASQRNETSLSGPFFALSWIGGIAAVLLWGMS